MSGLTHEEINDVERCLSRSECYERIFLWLADWIVTRESTDAPAGVTLLLNEMPSPSGASEADMDFVFFEILAGQLDWAYLQPDNEGIKLAAYATAAINARYPGGLADPSLFQSRTKSELCRLLYPRLAT